jgi:hypothetical protein
MNIEHVNRALTKAILSFQDAEVQVMAEAMAVGVTSYQVPSPGTPYKVPSPAEFGFQPGVTADYAAAHAVKDQAGWAKIFDTLRPGQILWVWYTAVMSTNRRGYTPFRVGRRGHSKKHNVSSISLMLPGQKKSFGPGWQRKLLKWGDGSVDFVIGDLGTTLRGLYVQKKGSS